MLCQFSIENFKSYKDTQTLNLEATRIKGNENHIINAENGESFFPLAAIYGPNGSGKSNFLEGIAALIKKVVNPYILSTTGKTNSSGFWDIPIMPFKFSEDSVNSPIVFDIFFSAELAEYHYTLILKNEEVVYENLEQKENDTHRRSNLFTRNSEGIKINSVIDKIKVSSDVSKELPLLTYFFLLCSSNPIIKDIKNWFLNSIKYFSFNKQFQDTENLIKCFSSLDEDDLGKITNLLNSLDINIERFELIPKYNGKVDVYSIYRKGSEEYRLNLLEESDGIKKLFLLLNEVILTLVNGATLIIDDIDADIHPVLIRQIIKMFSSKSSNTRGAQLIFSCHDLTIMNSRCLRRDEIWFVSKTKEQESQLYSLAEFKEANSKKVRNNDSYYRQYLEDKYGAIPFVRSSLN